MVDDLAPGLDPELQQLLAKTRLVMFDFDGVFTDNMVYVTDEGVESVRCTRMDGLGLRKLDAVGVDYMILSTETAPVVGIRAQKLGIRCLQGLEEKLIALKREIAMRGQDPAEVAFVGNDINDRDCLAAVGLPIVVRDAHPDVVGLARYRTRRAGGCGAVREVCDMIYVAKSAMPEIA